MTFRLDRLERLHGDWRALLRTRANVLITGPRHILEAFGSACGGEFQQPVACASVGRALRLERARTLVIVDVHLLDAVGQAALAAWMRESENAETQIISLSPEPLFPRVRSGEFDGDLFYRLNTIHLRLTDADLDAGD